MLKLMLFCKLQSHMTDQMYKRKPDTTPDTTLMMLCSVFQYGIPWKHDQTFEGSHYNSAILEWLINKLYWDLRKSRPLTPTVPCRDPSGSERLQGVSVAQQLLLLHLIQDVLAEHTGEAELAVAHQPEHQVHQLLLDVLRQLHQAGGERERRRKWLND